MNQYITNMNQRLNVNLNNALVTPWEYLQPLAVQFKTNMIEDINNGSWMWNSFFSKHKVCITKSVPPYMENESEQSESSEIALLK